MSVFRRQAEPAVFGLTKEHITTLDEFRQSQGWRILHGLLSDMVEYNAEGMLSSTQPEDLHFRRGVVWALRQLAGLPDTIVTTYGKADEHKQRQHAAGHNGRSADWKSVFLASPWWEYVRGQRER